MVEPKTSGITTTTTSVAIAGVVTALPATRIDNAYFDAKFGKTDVANVVKMIGVNERRRCGPGQTTGDLCSLAARELLSDLGWEASDIQLLIFVSQTPDYAIPATACVIHAELGLPITCAAFDVNLGCSGYVYGLWMAAQLMQGGGIRKALLLVGDTTYFADESDRSTAMVFGDAGAATALEYRPGCHDWHFVLGSDGRGARNLIVPKSGTRQSLPDDPRMAGKDPTKLFMDGGEIFNFTLRAIPPLGKALFEYSGTSSESFDSFLFHQANLFMLEHLSKKMKLPRERVAINIDRFGNTSSASIPLLMCTDVADSMRSRSTRLALFGFGVGYSWAAADIRCDPLPSVRVVELSQ
jgi:3-oxoacyl-[acyl-carrier-protein] synthase-3